MYRPAGDEDVPAIVALMNRAYRGSSGWNSEDAYIAGDRTSEVLLRSDLARAPSAHLLKWQADGREDMLGCVWLEPLGDGVWYIGSLAIEPHEQGGGLGREMLAAAEDWARRRGATRMRMNVTNVREALIAWYRRRGYRETGEIEPFPYGDDRFGTPLRDDLCFVVLEKALAGTA